MGKVITFGLQKGGVSKSTSTGIFSYLLSRDGFKVLAIDMDSQGNLTELLTNTPANEFIGNSVLEAIVFKAPKDYIVKVNENLDILPANNYLAMLPRWLHKEVLFGEKIPFEGEEIEQLALTIESLRNEYDFILIDTPPALSEQTTNSLVASDYVIVPFESSYFCLQAIPNFFESIATAQQYSKYNVEILGIVRTLNDKRRSDALMFNETIKEQYPEMVFETVITRKASTGRLAFYGFEENKEINDAIQQYEELYREFKERLRLKEVSLGGK